jgi:hypothetical protein
MFILLVAFSLSVNTSVVKCQENTKPIKKANLISSIRIGRSEGMTAKRYVELIESAGVAFTLSEADEKRIRRDGRYLGRKGLDDLIAAVRNNYRAAVSSTSAKDKETDEPTEVEMKEAWQGSMQMRGRLTADGCISADNAIAGVCIRITKFEKLGCKPASQGAGYFCTYTMATSLSFHSNEGSERGANQAKVLNDIMKSLGAQDTNGIVTSRFVRSKDGWLVSN